MQSHHEACGPVVGAREIPDNPKVRAFVDSLMNAPGLAEQIVHRHEIPSAPARWQEPREPLPPSVRASAARLGAASLYSHQAEALDRIRSGLDVAVVTPTASGKSLVNYLPTAELLAGGAGHALYLFPHKALEQDQHKKLLLFGQGLYGARDLTAEIYDGDTPASKRKKIRASPPDVLITNPEMLHMGLLAYHPEWARFFAMLRLVVIDELHVYRGVFGSHFAHVMRRLSRVTAHYGADPRYLVCSATIGNPAAFTEALLGRPFEVVSEAGAPRAGRHFLFVNPVASPYTVATRLFVESVRAGFRTIAFTKARRITELIHSWADQQLDPATKGRIASYRAGYLPEERRDIERRLFRGDLAGVIATSALELGIDVGGLDVCILVGYPGSMMSAWQRIGRVGRQDRESLVILVAQQDALDQYFMTHPQEFFTRGFEPAVVDPLNPTVARAHLVCAAAELPVLRDEALGYAGAAAVDALLADGTLVESAAGGTYVSLKRKPQREVNLRAGGASYVILANEGDRPIGSIDGVRVFHECHEGAIYLHRGASYRIVRLDEASRRVFAVPFAGDYYTQALGAKETEILETFRETEKTGYRLALGRLKVTVRIGEYAKKRLRDQETISKHPLDVPPIVFETVGFWMTLPGELAKEAVKRELHFMGGLHGSEHAMISLFPLLALCDRSDIGGISYSNNPQLGAPAIFIYDGYPGGIGLAGSVHDRIEALLGATRELLEKCPCEEGCPSCVQSPRCGSGNRPLDKEAARMVLRHLTGAHIELEPVTARPVEAASVTGADRGPDAGAGASEGVLSFETEPTRRGSTSAMKIGPLSEVRRAVNEEKQVAVPPPPPPPPTDVRRAPRAAGWATQPVAESAGGVEGRPVTGVMDRARSVEQRSAPRAVDRARSLEEGSAPRAVARARSIEEGSAPRAVIRGSEFGQTASPPPSESGGTGTGDDPGSAPRQSLVRLRPDEGRVLVFDVETQRSAEEVGGWNHISDMGLALAVVLDVRKHEYTTYFEKDVERLVLDLVMADCVIGYNSERFDFAVLTGYGAWDLLKIRSLDMLKYIKDRLGFRLKLGDLATANLGVGKSADGLQSLAWFKEGRLDLIEEYCRRDVEATAKLFALGRERGYLLYPDYQGRSVRLKIDW